VDDRLRRLRGRSTACAQRLRAWTPTSRTRGWLGKLGRGVEPLLAFLEIWPTVAHHAGEAALAPLAQATQALQKSPNGPAIVPCTRAWAPWRAGCGRPNCWAQYLALVVDLMQRTSISIHGRHATEPSPGLPTFLQQAPLLVGQVPLEGLRTWVLEGVRLHGSHPQRQIDFFKLATPDSRALLQRQRHGTLLVDVERRLELTLRGLWGEPTAAGALPGAAGDEVDVATVTMPYLQADGLRLPEVLDDRPGATAVQRYRAMLAHAGRPPPLEPAAGGRQPEPAAAPGRGVL
jgi:nitric oxide reductase NorD protein